MRKLLKGIKQLFMHFPTNQNATKGHHVIIYAFLTNWKFASYAKSDTKLAVRVITKIHISNCGKYYLSRLKTKQQINKKFLRT